MPVSLHLQEITPDNLETAISLKVRPDQEHAVAPVVKSLAEAYVHPGIAWPRLICDGDEVVGFLMAFFDIDWTGDGTDFRSGLCASTSRPESRAGATDASPCSPWPPRSGAGEALA